MYIINTKTTSTGLVKDVSLSMREQKQKTKIGFSTEDCQLFLNGQGRY